MMEEDNYGDSLRPVGWNLMIIKNILESISKAKLQHHKWKLICITFNMPMVFKGKEKQNMHGCAEILFQELLLKKVNIMDAPFIIGGDKNFKISWGRIIELLKIT